MTTSVAGDATAWTNRNWAATVPIPGGRGSAEIDRHAMDERCSKANESGRRALTLIFQTTSDKPGSARSGFNDNEKTDGDILTTAGRVRTGPILGSSRFPHRQTAGPDGLFRRERHA